MTSSENGRILDPEVYLKKHHIMAYIEDAVTFLLQRKDEDPKIQPYRLLAEYFESVKKGTHVLYRDYSFVSLTPQNRSAFVRLFWYCFSEIADRGDSMQVMQYLSLLRLLCQDFPSTLVQKVARVIFSYDALENLVSFADFLYAFQIVFYYESFLHRCELVCTSIVSGQNPLNLLDCASTVVVSMPSTAEYLSGGGNGSGSTPSGTRPGTAVSTQNLQSSASAGEEDAAVLQNVLRHNGNVAGNNGSNKNNSSSNNSNRPESQLQPDIFSKAVTNLCVRMEKEAGECCPSAHVLEEIIASLTSVTFYDFVLALSRSENVNGEIGALPERSKLLTTERSSIFNHLLYKQQEA